MRWLVLVLLLVLPNPPAGAAEAEVGIRMLRATVATRGQPIELSLWYPAAAGGTAAEVGASPIFRGIPVRADAPLGEGRLPLVLLAHGGLRANPNGGNWLAAALARRGWLVLVVPPPTYAQTEAALAAQEAWHRPADLRAALDALEADPDLAGQIDRERVAAVGFFLGGTAVLALAGAELDPAWLQARCDRPPASPDCRWFAREQVDLHRRAPAPVAAAQQDRRIRAVVAVDPELAAGFSAASLGAIAIPVTVVSLGASGSRLPWLDPAPLPDAIPGLRHVTIADADPFSAFALCTERALALLHAEGEDDAVCRDTVQPRAQIHARIVQAVEAALADRPGQPASGPLQ